MKHVDLGFTELTIADDYVIGRTREDLEVDLDKHNQVMAEIAKQIHGPFGFILDNINAYSVDLNVVLALKDDPNIACCAVVYYRPATVTSLSQAAHLIGKPTHFCQSIDEAIAWVRNVMSTVRAKPAT